MNNPRVQALFRRSRHINLSIFIISQDYYELPKRTIRANGNVYQYSNPTISEMYKFFFQEKASMDMTLNEFKLLTSTCWNINYQPFTIDKDRYQGRSRLGLSSIFVPDWSPF